MLGNIGLVRRIASFVPDKERGEGDEDSLDGLGEQDSEGDSEGSGSDESEEDRARVEERIKSHQGRIGLSKNKSKHLSVDSTPLSQTWNKNVRDYDARSFFMTTNSKSATLGSPNRTSP